MSEALRQFFFSYGQRESAISRGHCRRETIGYLGLVDAPGSLIGGKKSKHQVHLEVFTQDPRLDDVLANKNKAQRS
ncbi:hypothetical protein ACK309_03825 [Aeromonas caviae]